jgi:hypothetical protein
MTELGEQFWFKSQVRGVREGLYNGWDLIFWGGYINGDPGAYYWWWCSLDWNSQLLITGCFWRVVPQRYNSPFSVEWHPLAQVNLLRWPDGRFRKTRDCFGYTIQVLVITGGLMEQQETYSSPWRESRSLATCERPWSGPGSRFPGQTVITGL